MISTRHAVIAISSAVLGLPGVVLLMRVDKPASAAILGALLAVYGLGEFVAWLRQDRAARARYLAAEHAAAGPLSGYCPQVDDLYWDQVESRRWTA